MKDQTLRILTVCDRYNWGGASQVAKCLHEMLLDKGHDSVYLYGYDKKGLPNKKFPNSVLSASYKLGPQINYLSYSLFGKNIFPTSDAKLDSIIKKSDIIHIHNIHDYGFVYEQLIGKINKYNKPVVITCHDSWYLTGRCSIPKECIGWKNGCLSCSHKDYYHSSIFDFAAKERIQKLKAFNTVQKLLFVSPSKWLYENMGEVYGFEKCAVVSNSTDTSIFKYDVASEEKINYTGKPSMLLVANDYQDQQKVDINLIDFLIKNDFELHIVGTNSPFKGTNIINYGTLNSIELSRVMNRCDIHLFMSKIDNQPLVVLETLCTGMLQLTFRTKAITSLGIEQDCVYIDDYPFEKLSTLLSSSLFFEKKLTASERITRSEKYKELYSRDRMFSEYYSLYSKMLNS